jgi:hypothetical protein
MQLPPLIGTPFAEVDVKTEVKSVQNLRKQATKCNTSLSLLSFLHYSDQIRTSTFCLKSVDHTYLLTFREMVQFRNWSILRRLPLLYRNLTVEILSFFIPVLRAILLFTDSYTMWRWQSKNIPKVWSNRKILCLCFDLCAAPNLANKKKLLLVSSTAYYPKLPCIFRESVAS